MPRITANCSLGAPDRSPGDAGIRVFFSRMTCACAATAPHADAPLARALFHRVDVLKHSPESAARTFGLEPGDAAYLLAGLREEIARGLALALLEGRPAGEINEQKEATYE